MPRRPALDRARIVAAAVQVADRDGLAALSMRSLGRELGVEAMSLYHHLRGKDELLDLLADWPFSRITLPEAGAPWREAMRARAASAREVLTAHPWALGLVESRPVPGPAMLRHHESVLACLRGHGFSVREALHAFSTIDAYIYGFVLTERTLPDPAVAASTGLPTAEDVGIDPQSHPHLAETFAEVLGREGFTPAQSFGSGLAMILDGLAQRLDPPGR
ncbi:TetR/AcrR family transcriptional regulator [Brachybacterium phenoliresistens]|uniref:TetR/AcrR family transcriptional regulator n=1 Tax=Brachybacterium phenoliresistens TaxID=396014 RepID=UPI0031D27328